MRIKSCIKNKSSIAIALVLGLAVLPLGVMADDSDDDDAVSGFQPIDSVNRPVVYSVAFLATMNKKHKELARQWVDFLRSPEGVQVYVDGGFSALTGTEQAERYSLDAGGSLVIEQFTP